MNVLLEGLLFAFKALLVLLTFVGCAAFFFSRLRSRRQETPSVQLTEISARWRRTAAAMRHALSTDKKAKLEKAPEPSELPQARVFVIDYRGDMLASATESLREEVSAVVAIAEPADRVVLRLESAGGVVHGYGLAASQLARLRDRQIPLTVCVDKVAASGGYMMACVANEIVCAPFAVLGSIGVVAPLPNAHRLLKEHGVDYEDVTAGKHKRPVSLFSAPTEEGKTKLREQLEETHAQFKAFVERYRPGLDIEAVATGEHWHGARAHELGLCDQLLTSDDYLLSLAEHARVFELSCDRPRSMRERAAEMAEVAALVLGPRGSVGVR